LSDGFDKIDQRNPHAVRDDTLYTAPQKQLCVYKLNFCVDLVVFS